MHEFVCFLMIMICPGTFVMTRADYCQIWYNVCVLSGKNTTIQIITSHGWSCDMKKTLISSSFLKNKNISYAVYVVIKFSMIHYFNFTTFRTFWFMYWNVNKPSWNCIPTLNSKTFSKFLGASSSMTHFFRQF